MLVSTIAVIAAIVVIAAAFSLIVFGCVAASRQDRDIDSENHWRQCSQCRRWYNGIGEIRWLQEVGFDRRNQGTCPECTGEFQNN